MEFERPGLPACGGTQSEWLLADLPAARWSFFYGTPWSDDEMIRLGVGSKPGRPIGHMSMSGEDATIDDSAISVSAVGSLSKKRVCVRSALSTTTTNILFIS